MNELLNDETYKEQIMFIGQTLAPFFLEDPKTGSIQEAFEAIANLELDSAAEEWPFVAKEKALAGLTSMKNGLDTGISEDLIWEYRRLFIGPAAKPAPPWGSVYTDKECVVFGLTTLELRRWMRENGIERAEDEKTPEDHIGLMLVLMAWIAENKPELLEDYLQLHLLTWSSHFLGQLQAAATHPFYEGLAQLTKDSLEGIQESLGIEVDYPRFYR